LLKRGRKKEAKIPVNKAPKMTKNFLGLGEKKRKKGRRRRGEKRKGGEKERAAH
jgi:hypothetical protein